MTILEITLTIIVFTITPTCILLALLFTYNDKEQKRNIAELQEKLKLETKFSMKLQLYCNTLLKEIAHLKRTENKRKEK